MNKLIIHGRVDFTAAKPDLPEGLSELVTPKLSAQVQRARAGHVPHELAVENDDVVELELEEGIRLWVRAEFLEHDYPQQAKRETATGGFELPHTLPIGTPSRGFGQWVIKGLKVFGVDVTGQVTDFISDKVEGVLQPGPGLYRWGSAGVDDLKSCGTLKGSEPFLVFIHGTASSSDGSFGGLWESGSSSRMSELHSHYGDRILAFQHRTLTESPITNALELAKKLPSGARLHLVSHSRGGLVGELLCRCMVDGHSPIDQDDLEIFQLMGRDSDVDELKTLGEILATKKFVIERFVRVGCPARGTTLASGRLDRYLSVIINVLEKIPGFKANPVFDGASALLLAVIKKRTDPRELPGLEAQMPGSPLIALLNRPQITTHADLHVLGGDIAAKGIWGRLKTFATDLFYREDHDLVVNTKAMLGGTERHSGVQYWIDTGSEVNHFNYFRNSDTAGRLVSALTNSKTHDFNQLQAKPPDVTEDDYRKRAVDQQPVVFVLPGIMGSHLKVGDNRVWIDLWDLTTGDLEDLCIDAKNVSSDGLIGQGYKGLIRYLASAYEVIPFDYDWRKSILDTAERLRKQLEKTLDKTDSAGQPVSIIAHSMGGLVVRAMLATPEGSAVWVRMGNQPGSRLIMLGTPNGGSHAITSLLIGRDALVKKLALLDVKHSHSELLEIISCFDGVLQLLPHSGSLDAFDPATWQKLQEHDNTVERGLFDTKVATDKSARFHWPLPQEARLAAARKVRDLLQASAIDSDRMIYVAGVAPATACDVTIDENARRGRRVIVHATTNGDGRVPWATGIPSGLNDHIYYVDVEHGDLANHVEAFPGLLDLLSHGSTTKLARTPPVRRGIVDELQVLTEETPFMYPDEDDLIASALGSTGAKKQVEVKPKVRVRVLHGDLAWAPSPVVVGHYVGDTIVSAEAYLDDQLDGRLRESHLLGLYPGELDTHEIFLNEIENSRLGTHPGAIVVGLGRVGDLTPGGLVNSFGHAATQYAVRVMERERRKPSQNEVDTDMKLPIHIPLTSLLIGTGGAGLSVDDSLQSILRGIYQANQRLERLRFQDIKEGRGNATGDTEKRYHLTAFINEIVIVDLWEDLAIRALKSLLKLADSAEFRDHFDIVEFLGEGRGRRRRAYYDEDPSWWQRLRISHQKDGALKFEALTERARAETYLQPTQKKLVESFLKRAGRLTTNDPELCSTLFELLIPNQLKEYAPDRRNLALVLDAQSASYPWELLQDRSDRGRKPLAVEAGMIRQLAISKFREGVLHASDDQALVIGDPTTSEESGRFSPLPGAVKEARNVAKQLRDSGYKEVVELVGVDATPHAVLNALYAKPYRIVHIAAHGVFEYSFWDETKPGLNCSPPSGPCSKPKTVTGIVLGDGMFLTPAEIEQMRYVPELVFINCCHLGKTKGDTEHEQVQYYRLAANVSTHLIRMGVRTVVAAGWAVDDGAANAFARTFYKQILDGRSFGEAIRIARAKIYLNYRASNTWGAYQCYGDPDFSLTSRTRPVNQSSRLVAAAEVRVMLDSIVEKAKQSSDPNKTKRLLDDVERIVNSMRAEWKKSSTTCAAIGRAYAELGEFEKAIGYYETMTGCEPADADILSVEQLVNLKVRWAAQLSKSERKEKREGAGNRPKPTPTKLLSEAEKLLDFLFAIGETHERLSLKGSLYKRRSLVDKSKERRKRSLEKVAESYNAAYKFGRKNRRSDTYYPLENALAAKIMLQWDAPNDQRKREIAAGLKDLEMLGDDRATEAKDFWSLCILPSWRLLSCLYKGNVTDNDRISIVRLYSKAKMRGGSDREMRSVKENIEFLEVMSKKQFKAKNTAELSKFLEQLRKDLFPGSG